MKENKIDSNWLKGLPKLDLHCHLDGSMSLDTVRQLAQMNAVSLPKEEEELLTLLRAPEDCNSLLEYLTRFDLPLACLNSVEAFEKAAYDIAKEASKEGTIYLEVRFAPFLSVRDGLNEDKIVEAVCHGFARAKQDFGIIVNTILCGMRHHSPEVNEKVAFLAKKYLSRGVCAVDIAGDEVNFPIQGHQNLFTAAQKLEIPYTIHAGECGDVEEVRSAIGLGAKRIGHGIAMRGHDDVIALCLENKVGIEVCPISNLQTKAITKITEHPIAEFLKQGVLVSVNTDNRMVSNTSMVREFELIVDTFSLSKADCKQLMINAALTAFTDMQTKLDLIAKINAYR